MPLSAFLVLRFVCFDRIRESKEVYVAKWIGVFRSRLGGFYNLEVDSTLPIYFFINFRFATKTLMEKCFYCRTVSITLKTINKKLNCSEHTFVVCKVVCALDCEWWFQWLIFRCFGKSSLIYNLLSLVSAEWMGTHKMSNSSHKRWKICSMSWCTSERSEILNWKWKRGLCYFF